MDEARFNALADTELARLEALLDACDVEFDYEVKPGGVLELEFDNGTKIIVNRHTAAREIWLAAKSGGFHFRPHEGRWVGTRDGEDFYAVLSRCMGEQAGVQVRIVG